EEELTYAELNARANQLARHLIKAGVVAESLVAIYVERSLELIVAIAAALKSGAAYLPLDPAYPKERLDYVLQDSHSTVVLTQGTLVSNLPQYNGLIVSLDRDWKSIQERSRENLPSTSVPDNAAYVIYTSGSTGHPKGVVVSHANVGRLFDATIHRFHFDHEDVWTLFHSPAFDFSVWELWGALVFGGRVVVAPFLVSRSPQSFRELVCREQVTILNQTPSAFREFAQTAHQERSSLSLRLIIFGGEALDPASLIPWMVAHTDSHPRLINMYGITETTVHVTCACITGEDVAAAHRSLIGRPISDLGLYILDQCLELTPAGATGELHVGGAGLARGYLHRPELTAERFMANPFTATPGTRLYRSGDLGRRLPDGQIEYVGRKDDQVKIRGFRIELGEIQSLLVAETSVREALVIATEGNQRERQLIAYLVLAQDPGSSVRDLRSMLQRKLPDYMLPAAFVVLDRFPLTNNGKVDKARLPFPDGTRPDLEQAFVAPRSDEERAMADVWRQVLGLEQVGIDDNFFALGGDSIRSIRVRALAAERGLSFALEDLFQHQTIRHLTLAIGPAEAPLRVNQWSKPFGLVKEHDRLMLPQGVTDAYPLAMLQMGMLFHGEYTSLSLYHDVFSFHIRLPFNQEALRLAAQQLVDQHAVLRATFDLASFSEPLQLVHERSEASVGVMDLRHLDARQQETAVGAWIERETTQPFDLLHGPLIRFQAHLRDPSTFQFTLAFHHAILDGWSNASLLTELFHRYQLILGRRSDPASAAPLTSYSDFVAAERQSLESDDARQYWTQALEGASVSSLFRWPRQHGHATVSQANSRMEEISIPIDVSAKLHQRARDLGLPLKSVLLAAHLRVMSVAAGQDDVTTGVITNGRLEEQDGDRVLGLFLNTAPFRLKLTGGTWFDLVASVFETERRMFK
ncbi:MAG TPA: amino acid adenylation domain-containing protein, partial [Blastocatellia bacterium]|nr:amino acid adenylation domain-containing protein [Blastocatellia bacterium]